jgi:hypothetical protein
MVPDGSLASGSTLLITSCPAHCSLSVPDKVPSALRACAFSPHIDLPRILLFTSKETEAGRLCDLLHVTQLVSGEPGFKPRSAWLPKKQGTALWLRWRVSTWALTEAQEAPSQLCLNPSPSSFWGEVSQATCQRDE